MTNFDPGGLLMLLTVIPAVVAGAVSISGAHLLFAHYFEQQDVFEDLQEYYNRDAYRFEVPAEEFAEVRNRLQDAYYDLTIVENLEPYCVVKEKYTEHAEILRNCVLHWERGVYNFFLMKDDLSVKEALERGATKLAETDMVAGL